MEDTIYRQAAIDALDALCDRECEYSKKQRSVMCGACHLGSAFDVIEQLPSAQPTQTNTLNTLESLDCISRQAAIDALEREKTYCSAFREGYSKTDIFEKYNMGLTDGIKAIKNIPSAQPDIVLCKDCKHYEADLMGNPWGVCCHQDWVIGDCGSHVDEKGWCYRAERRTDGRT